MNCEAEQGVVNSLLTHLGPALCQGIQEGLEAAAKMAWLEAKSHHQGTLSCALGQARHFHSNEQFTIALDAAGVPHNPLRGNDIVIGQCGPLLLGRFQTRQQGWNNARRSSLRLKLAAHNEWLERLVQPGLFEQRLDTAHIAVFFVSVFSGSIALQPDRLSSVEIAVMDTKLSERLFSEPVIQFLGRYAQPADQEDLVRVRLKKSARKQQDSQP